MTLNDDEKQRDFIETLIASDDFYLFDTNVIGSHFFENSYDPFATHIVCTKFARENNLRGKLLRQTMRRTAKNLALIKTYDTIITTNEVIEELEAKDTLLKYASARFGVRGRHPKQQGRIAVGTVKTRKEKEMLEEIITQEDQIREVLKERVYKPPIEGKPFELLAIGAYHNLKKIDVEKKKNYNDEKILATALYIATVVGEGVVLISKDRGIEHLLKEVTREVYGDNCEAPLFLDALNRGKISIMKDIHEGGRYRITFSSVDYRKERKYEVPSAIKKRVEECEAVIREARAPSSIQESKPEAQSLYSSTA